MKAIHLLGLLVVLLFSSCSKDETIPTKQTKQLEVTLSGNSPEFWYYSSKLKTTTYLRQSHIVMTVSPGDVINAIGYGYSVDNSHNYGAPNVTVVGNIVFKVDGVVVAQGVDTLAYVIK